MERGILFRGKRVDNGEWVYGYYYHQITRDGFNPERPILWEKDFIRLIEPEGIFESFEVDHETVCEFIGLWGENETRIFEGDILNSIYKYRETVRKIIGVVEEDRCNPCFVIHYKWEGNKHDCYEYDFIQCNLTKNKVIGNIYDNPNPLL